MPRDLGRQVLVTWEAQQEPKVTEFTATLENEEELPEEEKEEAWEEEKELDPEKEPTENPVHNNEATEAERNGQGYTLNGEKRFVPDGHHADMLIVVARTFGEAGDSQSSKNEAVLCRR